MPINSPEESETALNGSSLHRLSTNRVIGGHNYCYFLQPKLCLITVSAQLMSAIVLQIFISLHDDKIKCGIFLGSGSESSCWDGPEIIRSANATRPKGWAKAVGLLKTAVLWTHRKLQGWWFLLFISIEPGPANFKSGIWAKTNADVDVTFYKPKQILGLLSLDLYFYHIGFNLSGRQTDNKSNILKNICINNCTTGSSSFFLRFF